MNAEGAVELIKQHGIFGLGEMDGCSCCNFEVWGVNVDIGCRKSSDRNCIRVYTDHMYPDTSGLGSVMAAVWKSYQEFSKWTAEVGDCRFRYCTYQQDHRDGGGFSCCYCGGERYDEDGYLCEPCRCNVDAVEMYPWGLAVQSPRITKGINQ